jgi:hypothetical protein
MLAFAMAAIRIHANAVAPPPKTMRRKPKAPNPMRNRRGSGSVGFSDMRRS